MKFIKNISAKLLIFLIVSFPITTRAHQSITIDKALTESKTYLKQLSTTHQLKLNTHEKNELLKAVNRFMLAKSNNNELSGKITISSEKLLEIKKELKKYCQSMYPEKFKKTRKQNYEQQKTQPPTQKQNKKPQKKARSKKQLPKKTHQPIGHYSNSRKSIDRISLANVNRIVGIQLEKAIPNPSARALLHKEIMIKIKHKATHQGFIARSTALEIITKEIKTFKTLQKKLSPSQLP